MKKKDLPHPSPLPKEREEEKTALTPALSPGEREKKKAAPVNRIACLSQLQTLVDEPLVSRLEIDGQTIEIALRRLKPDEEERLLALEREVLPPRHKGANGDQTYDLNAPEYLKARDRVATEVRALALYLACPMIREGRPDLAARADITAYVQGILTNHILDMLYLTLRVGGIKVAESELAERVGFTTTPGSDPS